MCVAPKRRYALTVFFDYLGRSFFVKAYEANRERLEEIDAESDSSTAWQLDTPLFRFVHLVWSRKDLRPRGPPSGGPVRQDRGDAETLVGIM